MFGDGARFEFVFDKVRAKNPQHDKFTALLRPDESGQLQLYYDTVESNLDDYFFVLRFLGEEGDVPQREIAKHLKMSVGKGVVSYLVGHAQCNGHIASVNEDLSSWPLVKNTAYEKAKLIDLLDMRAKDQHLINQKDHFVKNGRWTNSLSVGVAVEKVLRGTKPDRTAEYNQNSFAANLAMNYLIFKLGNNWQLFLNDVFQERVRIQSRIFFQKNGGLDESYGLGTYSMYATRYDYLRIAIAMIEDWQNGTCVGEYLKELVTRKQPKGVENWNDSDPKRMKIFFLRGRLCREFSPELCWIRQKKHTRSRGLWRAVDPD